MKRISIKTTSLLAFLGIAQLMSQGLPADINLDFDKDNTNVRIYQFFRGQKGDKGEKGDSGNDSVIQSTGFGYNIDSSYNNNMQSTGSVIAPFSSIQAALNQAASDCNPFDPVTLYVQPGMYDEDITISNLYNVSIVVLGPAVLGSSGDVASNAAPRGIYWQVDSSAQDGDYKRPSLVISQAIQGIMAEDNCNAFKITGNLSIINGSMMPANVVIRSHIMGTCTGNGPICLYTTNSVFENGIQGNLLKLSFAEHTQFNGWLDIFSYGRIINSAILYGMQVQSSPDTSSMPFGISQSLFNNNFNGPDGSLIVDFYTNSCFADGGLFGMQGTIQSGSKIVVGATS